MAVGAVVEVSARRACTDLYNARSARAGRAYARFALFPSREPGCQCICASHERTPQHAPSQAANNGEDEHLLRGHSTASRVKSTGVTMVTSPVSLSVLRNGLRV